eukprot:CAMPEP_0113702384 /NCGR_PEP_ID=MMETSP0038_2-20120614/25165_1 /TAXON_ID=2898 /ORGANISM="Cryptomonas paramecium" /LENGTH=195 /DNA_ID=CAMNT_0000626511 /DNA_START=73 /DNA_END=658 /DNA_ORIENTATION=+ /assembly_acc=CAM_ASM_000170
MKKKGKGSAAPSQQPDSHSSDEEYWECSMCLLPIAGVVWQCKSGHILCGDCHVMCIAGCPSCNIPLDTIRNRALERYFLFKSERIDFSVTRLCMDIQITGSIQNKRRKRAEDGANSPRPGHNAEVQGAPAAQRKPSNAAPQSSLNKILNEKYSGVTLLALFAIAAVFGAVVATTSQLLLASPPHTRPIPTSGLSS